MKQRSIIILVAAFSAGLSMPAWGNQNQNDNTAQTTAANHENRAPSAQALKQVESAKQLLGLPVQEAQNQKLGEIEDLAVDLHNGQFVEVVIDTSQGAHQGKRYLAVPPSILRVDANQKIAHLSVNQAQLTNAPQFEIASWAEYTKPHQITEVYRYYGQVNNLAATNQSGNMAVSSNATNHQGQIDSARRLLGLPVKNNQQNEVGNVDNMVLDLSHGRLVALVINAGRFLGLGDNTLSVVPPQAVGENQANQFLTLDMSKDKLANAPHFDRNQWPDFHDPNYVAQMYRAFGIQPYFTANQTTVTSETASGGTATPSTTTRTSSSSQSFGTVLRSNKLEGMAVNNMQNEKVGDVDSVVLDLTNGRVIAVVVSSGGFLGIGNTLSAVPPQALQMNANHDGLVLDINKNTLAGYPHFNGNQWPQFDDPNYVNSIYRAYNVTPPWTR